MEQTFGSAEGQGAAPLSPDDPLFAHPVTIAASGSEDAVALSSGVLATLVLEEVQEVATLCRLVPGGGRDPAASETLWQLVPTGRAGPGGHPLCWIVQYRAALMSAFRSGAWEGLDLALMALSIYDGMPLMCPLNVGDMGVLLSPEERYDDAMTWLVLTSDVPVPGQAGARACRVIPARLALTDPAGGFGFHGHCVIGIETLSFGPQGRLWLRVHEV